MNFNMIWKCWHTTLKCPSLFFDWKDKISKKLTTYLFWENSGRYYTWLCLLVVRVCAFFTLVLVLLGDIFNLIGIHFRSLTLIIFWQLSFMLYFILAYATVIASYISTIQTIIDLEVSPELGVSIILSIKQKSNIWLLIWLPCFVHILFKIK